MYTPRSCSIAKVSRALWPSASTTWSARSCSPPASVSRGRVTSRRARAARFDQHVGHALPKRISPPSASISARIFSTTLDQPEGADVRLGDVQDLSGAPALTNSVEHLARQVARVADLAPQLAVGEGAGAAFAELHVRLGVEHALAPQAPGVLGALAHRLAALQHDRPQAHLRQHQRGEDAAGAEADDHRARPRRGEKSAGACADEAVARVGRAAARAGRRAMARQHRVGVGAPRSRRV